MPVRRLAPLMLLFCMLNLAGCPAPETASEMDVPAETTQEDTQPADTGTDSGTTETETTTETDEPDSTPHTITVTTTETLVDTSTPNRDVIVTDTPANTGGGVNNNPIAQVQILGGELVGSALRMSILPTDAAGTLVPRRLENADISVDVRLIPESGGAVSERSARITGVDPQLPSDSSASSLVFDVSGSMISADPGAAGRRAGGTEFVDKMDGNDSAEILFFSSGNVSRIRSFTSDKGELLLFLGRFPDMGATNLWDAAIEALNNLGRFIQSGGNVVLLTDGKDNLSLATVQSVIQQANAQRVRVFTIALGAEPDVDNLQEVASATDGIFLDSPTAQQLRDAYCRAGLGVTKGFIAVNGVVDLDPAAFSGRFDCEVKVTAVDSGTTFTESFTFPVRFR